MDTVILEADSIRSCLLDVQVHDGPVLVQAPEVVGLTLLPALEAQGAPVEPSPALRVTRLLQAQPAHLRAAELLHRVLLLLVQDAHELSLGLRTAENREDSTPQKGIIMV